MSLPSKKDFQQAIHCLESIHAEDLIPADNFYLPRKKDLEALIKKVLETHQERDKCILDNKAINWLASKEAAKNAFRVLFKPEKIKETSIEKSAQIITERFWESQKIKTYDELTEDLKSNPNLRDNLDSEDKINRYLENINSTHSREERLRRKIESFAKSKRRSFEAGVFKSLFEYFYTDRWKEIYNEQKQIRNKLLEAKECLNTFKFIADNSVTTIRIHGAINQLERKLNEELISGVDSVYPLKRKDQTSRERYLVYSLYKNNMRHYFSPKTSFIVNLVTIEEINNHLDSRTIEKHISHWRISEKNYRENKHGRK